MHPYRCCPWRRTFAPLAVAFVFTATTRFPAAAAPTFANAVTNGTINIAGLSEASGIVASRDNSSVLWVHNDSGDSPRIFCIDTHGRKLGVYNVTGGNHVDYEDIGIGPGPVTNVSFLYVGDIGDNGANRSNIVIYQIPEPAVYSRQYTNPVTANLNGVRAITMTYPDGARNAESLFVDPVGGDLYILTKSNPSRIYTASKAKLDSTNNLTLAFVRTLSFDIPSAADISQSGNEIVVRQEDFAKLWTRGTGQSIASAFSNTPAAIPVAGTANGEPNGEAMGFDSTGAGYFTVTETAAAQPLRYFTRTSGDGPRSPQIILPAGSAWRYLDAGSDQGAAWRHADFDDSAWSSGSGPFGYGRGDEQTLVDYGGDGSNKYLTTYFRTRFLLDNAPCIESLTLKLVVDDGAAVYLNGVHILSFQLAADPPYNTPATAAQSTNLEDTWFSFPVDPSLLVNGTNTLAVEIHQAAVADPDIRFDLQLFGMESTIPRFMSWELGTNQFRLQLCGPSTTNVTVQGTTEFTNWLSIGSVVLTNGVGSVIDTQSAVYDQRFYRALR